MIFESKAHHRRRNIVGIFRNIAKSGLYLRYFMLMIAVERFWLNFKQAAPKDRRFAFQQHKSGAGRKLGAAATT